MAEIDYVVGDTNNGWINGRPAKIANTNLDNLINQYNVNQILARQGYKEPKNFMEALYMMFNNGNGFPQREKKQRETYFPFAIGF